MSFTVTPAATNDAVDLGLIHVEGWRTSYGGLVPQDFLDGLDAHKRAQQWIEWMNQGTQALIARCENNQPAGFIAFNKLMTPPPSMSPVRPLYTAEILALYVLPDFWRQGLGRRLMGMAAQALLEKKHKSACLWVLEKNARGNSFYKALGGERCGKKPVEIGGRTLTDICYGWRSIKNLLLPTE